MSVCMLDSGPRRKFLLIDLILLCTTLLDFIDNLPILFISCLVFRGCEARLIILLHFLEETSRLSGFIASSFRGLRNSRRLSRLSLALLTFGRRF